jgi:hypothetical protein
MTMGTTVASVRKMKCVRSFTKGYWTFVVAKTTVPDCRHGVPVDQRGSLVFSWASCALMKARMSSAISRSLAHCSL